MTSLDITSKALNEQIEILTDKFDYAVRRRDRLEQELHAAVEDCAQKKRELDLAMEEKRSLTRMKLSSRTTKYDYEEEEQGRI